MGNALQVISFLVGFAAYAATGSLTFGLGVSLALLAIEKITPMRHAPGNLTPFMLGVLSAIHLSACDWLALSIIAAAVIVLFCHKDSLAPGKAGLTIALIAVSAGISSRQLWLLAPGLIATLLCLRFKQMPKPSFLARLALLSAFAFINLHNPFIRNGPSVYLEHGKWATDSGDYGVPGQKLNLKNETTYSYTWMVRIISDRKGEALSLSDEDATAWLVTPTKPFTTEEITHVQRWVRRGGRLIVIADHTDYVGHARCLNQLLTGTGINVEYGAFLPELESDEKSQTWSGTNILTKTPTIATSTGMCPLATSLGYFEAPDYSRPGFFGPCSPSSDDRYGRHLTGGISRIGLGSVIYWGDSTLFSNFAIFQPDSMELLTKLASPRWCAIAPTCVLMIFTCCLFGIPGVSIPMTGGLILLAALTAKTPKDMLSRFDTIAWSGDKRLVDDKYDPKASFSTAFAISSASGKLPRWTDSPDKETGGIWISETPPPTKQWRWLTPYLEVVHAKTDNRNPWDALVRFVNPEATYTTKPWVPSGDKADAGGVWTNEGVGSWWFGMGTSPARLEKLGSFNEWIRSGKTAWTEPSYAKPVGEPIACTAVLEGGKRLGLKLPRIQAKMGEYVYLGAGISGLVTDVDGKTMITGSRDKDCFGYSNTAKQASWVFFYDADMTTAK